MMHILRRGLAAVRNYFQRDKEEPLEEYPFEYQLVLTRTHAGRLIIQQADIYAPSQRDVNAPSSQNRESAEEGVHSAGGLLSLSLEERMAVMARIHSTDSKYLQKYFQDRRHS